MHCICAFRRGHDVDIVQAREQDLPIEQLGLYGFQRWMLLGLLASPCSPPSPWTIVRVVPPSSSRRYLVPGS